MLRFHAGVSLFASWDIIRLWSVKSKSCLTIFLSISHFACPDCLIHSVIHLPQRHLPLFSGSPSLSCRSLFLCCSKHICPSFISLWSDSDNAESVFMTQYVLTVCLCGIAPHTHLLSSSPFFWLICFYFTDKLIALPLLNNWNVIDLPSVVAAHSGRGYMDVLLLCNSVKCAN